MKASLSAVAAAAVVVLVSALAETRPSSALHPETLARFEAITSYCEQADPGSGSGYAMKLAGIVRGHSNAEIQQDRNSEQYRQAMAQAHTTLARAAASIGSRGCAEFLAEK